MHPFEPYKRALADIGPIITRHVFLLINVIVFIVVVLLYVFQNRDSALFLSLMVTFNILIGIVQDVRARVALETLQLLTALKVTRINTDESESVIYAEQVQKGDHIKLVLGDQIPCDGTLLVSIGIEVSEALITGESDSIPKATGATVNAGAIVTAGVGTFEAQTNYAHSTLAQMTAEAKRYSEKPSPIELAIRDVIRYAGYILLLVVTFVVVRGFIVHEDQVKIILDVGALASAIIPQGLVVVTTLFFAFGAAIYARKHVLFQEINVTEKLGRIENLCMDKTGTLTSNTLSMESMVLAPGVVEADARSVMSTYLSASGDTSQMLSAIAAYLGDKAETVETVETVEVVDTLPFSSWRQFGALTVRSNHGEEAFLVGSPDAFIPHCSVAAQAWAQAQVSLYAAQGKRMLCVAKMHSRSVPRKLDGLVIMPLALFVLHDELRDGIQEAIAFFQKRNVRIRIISGDNPRTVCAIALAAGVSDAANVITGTELDALTPKVYDATVNQYTIFARITPQQKVRLIEAFKKSGFTAMVGDGANDALAIKKADLGIAMFAGVPATRRLAGVVLTKNSFTDLPGGVLLADNFIRNIEVFAGIFITQSFIALFFFAIISVFGYSFPLAPLNISLINYFTVGIPGMLIGYWAIAPTADIAPAAKAPFLTLVLSFSFWSGVLQAFTAAAVFALGTATQRAVWSNSLVGLTFIICGFVFFAFAPRVYRGAISYAEKIHLVLLALVEVVLLIGITQIPFMVRFFSINITMPPLREVGEACGIIIVYIITQYILTKTFFTK